MQGACYSHLASTLYTLAARHQSRKQITRVRCGLTAQYCCGFVPWSCLRIGPRRLQSWESLLLCDTILYMHAPTGTMTLLMLPPCDFREQPSGVESSCAVVCKYYPTMCCSAVFRALRVCVRCVPCVTHGAFSSLFFSRQSLFFVLERPSSA